MAEQLEYLVSLRGGEEAAAKARALASAVDKVGGNMGTVGKRSEQAEPGVARFEKSLRRTAVALGAVGAGYAAWNQAKSAIEFTHSLAEGTSTLTKSTGMSTEASSRWIGVANALGVSGNSVGTAFTKLATAAKAELSATDKSAVGHEKQTSALKALEMRQHTAMVIAEASASHSRSQGKAEEKLSALRLRQGTELATATLKQSVASKEGASAFQELGISADFVRQHQHDMGAIMETVIEKLDTHLPAGVSKSAVMTKLFGRSWQDLSPLLLEGRKHLDELLESAKKFGVELHGNTQEKLEEYRKKQIEAKLATEGLQLAFTELAAGPIGELLTGFSQLASAVRTGDWAAFDKTVNKLSEKLVSIAEVVIPHVAEAFAMVAPKILVALWHGFEHASLPGEAVIIGALLIKFGLAGKLADVAFGAAGAKLGGVFAGGFVAAEAAEIETAGTVFTSGLAAPSMLAKFAGVGKLLGGALFAALAVYAVKEAEGLPEKIAHAIMPLQPGSGDEPLGHHFTKHVMTPGEEAAFNKGGWPAVKRQQAAEANSLRHYHGHLPFAHKPSLRSPFPHGALGAGIMRGGFIEVGERGPEVVNMPTGAAVQPLEPGSMAPGPTILQIDGRELMRVVRRHTYEAAAEGAGSG